MTSPCRCQMSQISSDRFRTRPRTNRRGQHSCTGTTAHIAEPSMNYAVVTSAPRSCPVIDARGSTIASPVGRIAIYPPFTTAGRAPPAAGHFHLPNVVAVRVRLRARAPAPLALARPRLRCPVPCAPSCPRSPARPRVFACLSWWGLNPHMVGFKSAYET